MLSTETINQLLGITESYKAPEKMLSIMLDDEKRPKLFNAFLEHEHNMTYEWFQSYFENEHSDRKKKKQDFTPNAVSQILAGIIGETNDYYEIAAGTGGIMINHWAKQRAGVNPLAYNPRNYWYKVEELSDRSIPFLIFNMAIRGINGIVLHGDSITRRFKDVYFIRNDTTDYMRYSEVFKLPHSDELALEVGVKEWGVK